MTAISQATFLNVFSRQKSLVIDFTEGGSQSFGLQ